jgi:hypothetical protein
MEFWTGFVAGIATSFLVSLIFGLWFLGQRTADIPDEWEPLRQEHKRFRDALVFYARKGHYEADIWGTEPIMVDSGQLARTVLTGVHSPHG